MAATGFCRGHNKTGFSNAQYKQEPGGGGAEGTNNSERSVRLFLSVCSGQRGRTKSGAQELPERTFRVHAYIRYTRTYVIEEEEVGKDQRLKIVGQVVSIHCEL